MPDKKYDELSDKGWMAMAITLDREMPIKRDRRWMLLLLLMSMGLGAAGLVYWNMESREQVVYAEINDLKSQGAIDKEEIVSENAILNDEVSPIIKAVAAAPDAEKVSANSNNISRTPSQSLDREVLRTFSENANFDNERPDAIVEKENFNTDVVGEENLNIAKSIVEINLDRTSKQFKSVNMEDGVIDVKAQSDGNTHIPAFVTYPQALSVSPLIKTESKEGIQILDKVFSDPVLFSQSTRKPVSVRFYAGLALPLTSTSKGFFVGTSFIKALNPRWKIEAGLGMFIRFKSTQDVRDDNLAFNAQDGNGGFDPALDVDQERVVFANNTNEVRQEYYGIVNGKLLRSTYLELPIEMKYKVSQRHEVGTGFRYGYLLSARNDRIYLAEFASSLAVSEGYLSPYALTNAKVINRHNISLISSYRYSLTKRWGLFANVNIGLNNIIRTNGDSNANNRLNYIGLGIDYRLKM